MKTGDIVALGRHRLMCGDAFNDEHVDALMQGEKAAMLCCDPPYGMNLQADYPSMRGYGYGSRPEGSYPRAVIGDDAPFDPRPIIERFAGTREQFWWGADYYAESLPTRNAGSWIVWDKRLEERFDRMFGSTFELCWSRRRHRRETVRILWAFGMGVPREPDRRRHHPTQKPVALAEWFLERYSKPDALVVDLFAGSGSTLLACERMNRRAYVMEISPDYCQVIVNRYEQMVGTTAGKAA